MATRQFTRNELLSSERFIAQLASEHVPDGDFGEGTDLRDMAIRAIAATVMFMQSEADAVRALSELNSIREIEDETERTEALDAFASNLFLTRGGGSRSRGFVEVSLSSQSSGTVPIGTRFLAGTLVFFLDSSSPLVFASSDLRTVTDSVTGETRYVFRVPVIAVAIGEDYDIDARLFSAWDPFHPDVVRVESINRFSGGGAEETVDEFIEDVETAITVRNLLTPRSINTVLPEEFPDITSVQVVEAGDAEMTRDLAPLMTRGLNIHTGGATDVYVFTSVVESTFDLVVGTSEADVAGPLDTFLDIDLDARNVDWRGRVREGDILRLHNARSSEGTLYTIVEVDSFYVRVQPLIPFKELRPLIKHGGIVYTEVSVTLSTRTLTFSADTALFVEDDVGSFLYINDAEKGIYLEIESIGQFVDGFATEVTVLDPNSALATLATISDLTASVYDDSIQYSIGDNYPSYDNKVPLRNMGRVTRESRTPGTVVLPNAPIYRFKDVILLDPTDPNADAIAGGILFTEQVTEPPPVEDPPVKYQVLSRRIDHAQSAQASLRVRVGPEDVRAGEDGLFSNIAAEEADFESASTTFVVGDVGTFILIARALNQVNLGLYRVDSYISPTKVRVSKVAGPVEFTAVTLVGEANMGWRVDARFIYDDRTLRVTYETLQLFDTIANFVDAGEDRVVAASTLARAPHPVYVGFQLQYQLKPTASSDIDTDVATRFLANFIREFPAFDVLNVSDIVAAFRAEYETQVGNVKSPMAADYFLVSPDGSLVNFQSTDEIVLRESLVATADDAARYAIATAHGVSDRTTKYLSFEDLITVVLV